MFTHASKQEKVTPTVQQAPVEIRSAAEPVNPMVDVRPETNIQARFQEIVRNSPQLHHMAQLQAIVQRSARGPQVAQRKPTGDATGGQGVVQRIMIEGNGISNDAALQLIHEHWDEFEYKYHDYLLNEEFMDGLLNEIDAWNTDYENSEAFFQIVRDRIDSIFEHHADQLDAPLEPLQVAVPPLDPKTNNPAVLVEIKRQLMGQVEALNRMSVADWLRHVLLNRMKSLDVLVSKSIGTKTGKRLGDKINDILYKYDDIARFAMDAVISNLTQLTSKYEEYSDSPLISELFQVALIAKTAPEGVYLTFEELGGVQMMAELNMRGMEGGMGRAHGKGDEKWFRAEFLDGVNLLKLCRPDALESNAILHNPDQCAGGDMEVESQELDGLIEARDRYRHAARLLVRLRQDLNKRQYELGNLQNDYQKYDALLPGWQNFSKMMGTAIPSKAELQLRGQKAEQDVAKLTAEIQETENELTAAADAYQAQMFAHLGNYGVNSLLGREWMAPMSADGGNRVEIMLDQVLDFASENGLGKLDSMHMDLHYDMQGGDVVPDPDAPQAVDVTDPEFLKVSLQEMDSAAPSFGKKQLGFLQQSGVSLHGKQQSLYSAWNKQKGQRQGLLANVRQVFQIGYASGVGMNCLIRAILRANGHADDDATVQEIRRDAMALGLVAAEEEFDLHQGGGAAVLQQIQHLIGGGFHLHVIQVNPIDGGILSHDSINVGGGGNNVYIMHLGNHFSPLVLNGDFNAWINGVPHVHYDL